MANVIDLSDNNFEAEVINSQIPVVVDFWATWCGTCRKLSPVIDSIAEEYSDRVKFAKVNIEECIETAKKYAISGLPSILVFKNGEPVERMAGSIPKSTIILNIEKSL